MTDLKPGDRVQIKINLNEQGFWRVRGVDLPQVWIQHEESGRDRIIHHGNVEEPSFQPGKTYKGKTSGALYEVQQVFERDGKRAAFAWERADGETYAVILLNLQYYEEVKS